MELHTFYYEAFLWGQAQKWRYGQALFNHLCTIRPDLAEQIRGTSKDPFHKNTPAELAEFTDFLESNWQTPAPQTNTKLLRLNVDIFFQVRADYEVSDVESVEFKGVVELHGTDGEILATEVDYHETQLSQEMP